MRPPDSNDLPGVYHAINFVLDLRNIEFSPCMDFDIMLHEININEENGIEFNFCVSMVS